MKALKILIVIPALISLCLPACSMHGGGHPTEEQQKIVVTTPKLMDVVITQQYVCQIHSLQHIKVRALQSGYLEPILVKEGQMVKKGDLMFRVIPILYKAKLDAELAELRHAELELKFTESLFTQKPPVVSQNEVFLYQAKVARAQAKAKLAEAELMFTEVKAPFDGIVDRQEEQQRQPHQGRGRAHDLVRQQFDVGLFQRARGPLSGIHGRGTKGKRGGDH